MRPRASSCLCVFVIDDMDSRAWLAHLEQFGIKLGLDTITAIVGRAGASRARLPRPARRRHQRQGIGQRDGKPRAHIERPGHGPLHLAAPGASRRALRRRRPVGVGRRRSTRALDEVRRAVGQLQSAGTLTVEPTYFEATTAAAFVLFRAADADVAVIEVGLGGRYDATNIVAPLVTAITSVDFDHQAQLGTTLAAIAGEKAGTIKPGVPVVVGPLPRRGARGRRGGRARAGGAAGRRVCRRRRRRPTRSRTSPRSQSRRRRGATARCGWPWPAGIRWTTPSSRCVCSRRPRALASAWLRRPRSSAG